MNIASVLKDDFAFQLASLLQVVHWHKLYAFSFYVLIKGMHDASCEVGKFAGNACKLSEREANIYECTNLTTPVCIRYEVLTLRFEQCIC